MLYSTTTPVDDKAVGADANTYRPFKILNTAITHTILEQVDSLGEADIEGKAFFILSDLLFLLTLTIVKSL
jgi:transcription initiation factor TFIIH subunit 3